MIHIYVSGRVHFGGPTKCKRHLHINLSRRHSFARSDSQAKKNGRTLPEYYIFLFILVVACCGRCDYEVIKPCGL